MTVLTFVGLGAGLVILVLGAQALVGGASSIATRLGVSSLIIGLTVVAYGTSAPEMAVSVAGAIGGQPGVALGNVVGSTVANILLILGLSASFGALVVARRLIRVEVPIMIGISVVVVVMASNNLLGRLEALALVALAVAYTAYTIRSARKQPDEINVDAPTSKPWSGLKSALAVAGGLGALVVGSQLLVNNAIDIASALGLSDVIIGLTVVAVGTSLPELATSVTAVLKGDGDLAVGNVIGSNIFNLSIVLGASGLASSSGIPVPDSVLRFDLLVMLAVCIACLPIFLTRHCVQRWEGMVFLAYYVTYVTYLVLNATDHSSASLLADAMVVFVIPLTVLTIGVLVFREIQRRKDSHGPHKAQLVTSKEST